MIMMNSSKKRELENQRQELIDNLDYRELEVYMKKLAKKYYISLINQDENEYENTLNAMNELIFNLEGEYPNIHEYMNYFLIESSNEIYKIIFDVELFKPMKTSLKDEKGLKTLAKAFASSKRKYISYNDYNNMKKLYKHFMVDSKCVDEDILNVFYELYNSFLASQGVED